MLELRWLECDMHDPAAAVTGRFVGSSFYPMRPAKLQYRNAAELISQDRSNGSATWTTGTDWQDCVFVPMDKA